MTLSSFMYQNSSEFLNSKLARSLFHPVAIFTKESCRGRAISFFLMILE